MDLKNYLRILKRRWLTIVLVGGFFIAATMLYMASQLVLSPIVDAIIFLVSAGETNKDEESFAKRLIESAKGKLIGCILNKLTIESRGYYYYYYYYEPYKYYRET